jgi:hypothetical protein
MRVDPDQKILSYTGGNGVFFPNRASGANKQMDRTKEGTLDPRPRFRKPSVAAPFAKVVVVKDNKYVYSSTPKRAKVAFTWRDNYYYLRGEQEDVEVIWVSPMWVKRK